LKRRQSILNERIGTLAMSKTVLNDKGIVLVAVLLLIVIMTLLGLGANRSIIIDTMALSSNLSSAKAFHAAEAGAIYGFNRLWWELQKPSPDVSTVTPPVLEGYTIEGTPYIASVGGPSVRIATGAFAGLTALIQKYRITSIAIEGGNNGVGQVVLEVEDQLIPLFQFGLYYDDDLELGPGTEMAFTGGRIHSNGNTYITAHANSSLSIDAIMTSARNVYHSDKANRDARDGTVRIKDAGGTYHVLDYDSSAANWATQSQVDWNGRVRTDLHGITPLKVPSAAGGETVDLIGTGADSLYTKSGLRVINGVATNKNGNAVDIRYFDPCHKNADGQLIIDPGGTADKNVNPITLSRDGTNPVFYDGREQRTMTAVELDMAKLQNSPAARAALNDPPSGGDPGMLYISSDNITNAVVRLTNGGTLDNAKLPRGLSVVTDNPLYVQGNYNTANRAAAFYADSVTVLSGNWSDANSTGSIENRVAAGTTVNAAIMAGNRNTSEGDYSGGAENLIRFLEKWSGTTMTYRGSLACLWQSRQASGKWPGPGSVYMDPVREWSYGINYNNLPPGTPRVRNIVKTGWRQVTQ
jgi:hypothetical protein